MNHELVDQSFRLANRLQDCAFYAALNKTVSDDLFRRICKLQNRAIERYLRRKSKFSDWRRAIDDKYRRLVEEAIDRGSSYREANTEAFRALISIPGDSGRHSAGAPGSL